MRVDLSFCIFPFCFFPFRILRALAGILLIFCLVPTASAHFLLNLNVRIFHVEHHAEGFRVYARMPMPYLLADKVGPEGIDGLPSPAPYSSNRMEDDRLVHYIDFRQLREQPQGLGELLSNGLHMRSEDQLKTASVEQVRVYPLGLEPGFATLDEARASFDLDQAYPDQTVYVGDGVVDVTLNYSPANPLSPYEFSSTLDPGLPGQEDTANLLLDYGSGAVKVFRLRGLLDEPVLVSGSSFTGFVSFIKEGVRHILEGLDHMLFVLCLAAGATHLSQLLWRVTGFTLGHSITLSAGFFGYVPSAAWFVPAVEAAIALSIIYAAVIVAIPKYQSGSSERTTFMITSAIGLIHGLGFSFVLHNILNITSPNIWQSLLAFNLGIELGQLLIVLLALSLLWAMGLVHNRASHFGRLAIAISSTTVAVYWVFERTAVLV